jgi:SAM-dependent methyltransferase
VLNYEFAVDLTKRLVKDTHLCVLDYGCGAGQIVKKALDAGFDAYGVEEFYEGGSYEEDAKKTGMLGARILELKKGIIPFPNQNFDVVISNQVFEHIDDYTLALSEIDRVLKPAGIFINIFPSVGVWREGHIGIPFAHWFKKGSQVRFYYVTLVRTLGLGFHKKDKSIKQWAVDQLDWIDKWTFYKPISEIERNFARYFTITYYDADYILFRLKKHVYLSHAYTFFSAGMFRPVLNFACAKFASRIFVLRKR